MCPLLHYASILQHDNDIRIHDGPQSMRDKHARPPAAIFEERSNFPHQGLLGVSVQGARRFVEE